MDMPFGPTTSRKVPEDQEVSEVYGLEPHTRSLHICSCLGPSIHFCSVGEHMNDNFNSPRQGTGYKIGMPSFITFDKISGKFIRGLKEVGGYISHRLSLAGNRAS